jgi:hypothetical protein
MAKACKSDNELGMSYGRITNRGSSSRVITQDQESSEVLDSKTSVYPFTLPDARCALLPLEHMRKQST